MKQNWFSLIYFAAFEDMQSCLLYFLGLFRAIYLTL